MKLGQMNTMSVVRRSPQGLYLAGDETGDVLLPTRYVPNGTKIGDELDVFLYLDQDERLVATTLSPLAMVGDFAFLKVAWVNNFGAFLEWGLMKDLFVPFREQKMKMLKGQSYIVHVHLDKESGRIMASAKVEHFFDQTPPTDNEITEKHNLLVWQKTDLGFKVIVDNRWPGLIYDNEIFTQLHTGDRIEGYIKQVRADGKIDCTLHPTAKRAVRDFADVLLEHIVHNGGRTTICDHSAPEEIYALFGVSKKVFKQAVGKLYKQRKIVIADDVLQLADAQSV